MGKEVLPRGRGAWFEGWYLKQQGDEGGLALIPAIHRGRRGDWTASLQVITQSESWMISYPIEGFHRWPEGFQIRMGENWFSSDGVHLDVDEPGLVLRGELRYGPLSPPQKDIMGPFCHVPHMQCVHGILSMGHEVDGLLWINGELMGFSKGWGYLETDRGRSFPKRYLWTQCSWWERQRVGLMLAIATIPMGLGSFTGCICQISFAGKQYRLATYLGARVKRWSDTGAEVHQGKLRLVVEVLERSRLPLQAPVGGVMSRTIYESLYAVLRFRLWEGEQLIFDHIDQQASFEYSSKETKNNSHPL